MENPTKDNKDKNQRMVLVNYRGMIRKMTWEEYLEFIEPDNLLELDINN